MSSVISFFQKLGPEILTRTFEHIYLVFFAMLIAVVVALFFGYLSDPMSLAKAGIHNYGHSRDYPNSPKPGFIAFIVIIFALVKLPTIGTVPALVALVLYALLPILRNTYTGIRQVDASIIEVATGMGMKPYQILFSVELPLSLPVVMAGIRISTVWTIGVATLCGLIGAGGLGDLIIKGLRSIRPDYLLAGTLPAAALALISDWILGLVEKWLTPKGLTGGADNPV